MSELYDDITEMRDAVSFEDVPAPVVAWLDQCSASWRSVFASVDIDPYDSRTIEAIFTTLVILRTYREQEAVLQIAKDHFGCEDAIDFLQLQLIVARE